MGVSHTSMRYYFIYFLAIIALILLFPFIMKFFTGFKENYGKGYGYVPRDLERIEKLTREGKAIPFQPTGKRQREGEQRENDKKKSVLNPYR